MKYLQLVTRSTRRTSVLLGLVLTPSLILDEKSSSYHDENRQAISISFIYSHTRRHFAFNAFR
jgi:hypothetical protein